MKNMYSKTDAPWVIFDAFALTGRIEDMAVTQGVALG